MKYFARQIITTERDDYIPDLPRKLIRVVGEDGVNTEIKEMLHLGFDIGEGADVLRSASVDRYCQSCLMSILDQIRLGQDDTLGWADAINFKFELMAVIQVERLFAGRSYKNSNGSSQPTSFFIFRKLGRLND